jgi:hypothetical protein
MKRTRIAALALSSIASVASCPHADAANLLVDPGFENPALYTTDGPPFVGSWEAFTGGASTFSVNDTLSPNSGARAAHLGITATNNTFAGFFQDVPITTGVSYTYSGFHESANLAPADYVAEVRIEWRNSVSNVEVLRNQVLPIAGATYTPFSLTAIAPAGADTARVVYAIQTFSDSGTSNTGKVFVDDLSLAAATPTVPLPSSLAGGSAGFAIVIGLARHRRRRP